LLHRGQSVLLLVSMTFLRSPVFATLAIKAHLLKSYSLAPSRQGAAHFRHYFALLGRLPFDFTPEQVSKIFLPSSFVLFYLEYGSGCTSDKIKNLDASQPCSII